MTSTDRLAALAAPLEPVFATDGECDGDGWVVVNPDWPSGNGPYRERCSGCDRCETEE